MSASYDDEGLPVASFTDGHTSPRYHPVLPATFRSRPVIDDFIPALFSTQTTAYSRHMYSFQWSLMNIIPAQHK